MVLHLFPAARPHGKSTQIDCSSALSSPQDWFPPPLPWQGSVLQSQLPQHLLIAGPLLLNLNPKLKLYLATK